MLSTRTALVLTIAALGLAAATPSAAGPLNPPPGPVAPTGKPIAEVEPRIAVNAANTPGGSTTIYRITSPGSYYLTGNVLGEAGKSGIEIASGNVTLDLMGFSVIGVTDSHLGIRTTTPLLYGVTIRNGTVTSFGEAGVDTNFALTRAVVIENVMSIDNGGLGIACAPDSVIRDCVSRNNSAGILAGSGSIVTGCIASHSHSTFGISVANGSTVSNCAAQYNGTIGIRSGDGLGAHTTISDCSSCYNGTDGIVADSAVVTDCVANFNTSDGIRAKTGSLIADNVCRHNGNNGDGAGIAVVTSGDCRIEGNNVCGNDRGIEVSTSGNIVIGNTASGNGVNYQIGASNTAGPIISAATINGNTNPAANYEF